MEEREAAEQRSVEEVVDRLTTKYPGIDRLEIEQDRRGRASGLRGSPGPGLRAGPRREERQAARRRRPARAALVQLPRPTRVTVTRRRGALRRRRLSPRHRDAASQNVSGRVRSARRSSTVREPVRIARRPTTRRSAVAEQVRRHWKLGARRRRRWASSRPDQGRLLESALGSAIRDRGAGRNDAPTAGHRRRVARRSALVAVVTRQGSTRTHRARALRSGNDQDATTAVRMSTASPPVREVVAVRESRPSVARSFTNEDGRQASSYRMTFTLPGDPSPGHCLTWERRCDSRVARCSTRSRMPRRRPSA